MFFVDKKISKTGKNPRNLEQKREKVTNLGKMPKNANNAYKHQKMLKSHKAFFAHP